MTIEVDTSVVRGGVEASGELAADVNLALEYFDSHIDTSQSWVAGALMDSLLAEYDVAQRFDDTEHDARVDVRNLFSDLGPTATTVPLTASTARQSLAFAFPIGALAAPESSLADPAFEVVRDVPNWPDLLSPSFDVYDAGDGPEDPAAGDR